MTARCVSAVLALLASPTNLVAAGPFAQTSERRYEGDWYVSDQTDNVTGEREVYAFQNNFPVDQPGYVSLTMKCSGGTPLLLVDWSELSFPDQSVVSIGPMLTAGSKAVSAGYVFEKSDDPVEAGLRTTPEISAKIISSMANAKFATITVRPVSGVRTVTMEIDGATGAWARVSRHCPIRTMAVPPM